MQFSIVFPFIRRSPQQEPLDPIEQEKLEYIRQLEEDSRAAGGNGKQEKNFS